MGGVGCLRKGKTPQTEGPGGECDPDGHVTMRPRHKENGKIDVENTHVNQEGGHRLDDQAARWGSKASSTSRKEAKKDSWLIVATSHQGPWHACRACLWLLTFTSALTSTHIPQYIPPHVKSTSVTPNLHECQGSAKC